MALVLGLFLMFLKMVMTGRACGVAVLVVSLFVCLIFILGVGGGEG